jgi:predicted RNA-binding protein
MLKTNLRKKMRNNNNNNNSNNSIKPQQKTNHRLQQVADYQLGTASRKEN